MNSTETARRFRYDDALIEALRTGLALECRYCQGLICLDCADRAPHALCTRVCPQCADSDDEVGQAWALDAVITELAGLHRLDEAIRALPPE